MKKLCHYMRRCKVTNCLETIQSIPKSKSLRDVLKVFFDEFQFLSKFTKIKTVDFVTNCGFADRNITL